MGGGESKKIKIKIKIELCFYIWWRALGSGLYRRNKHLGETF
jgi:hypothetical protein